MKKIFITALLSIILILTTFSTALALEEQSIKFHIDGYERPEITAQIVNQTTFVPLRIINNQFSHLQTAWDNNKIVSVTNSKTNEVLKFSLESNIAYKGGKQISLSTPARIINGVTYVPLRFISETMGLFVHWDSMMD
ncbi:copper amine oxidase N-terminal domain-containing protein [Desulfoscipio gibsoniae]|uniref:Copper amine oxidase family protein n=1 Tax=Desulfoscipio gibsoniae DSM 7213 TaxID=767817 RepID=R4KUL3_9FIRM|nr:copper amine oxidase N-terminal domain-containing protein [Desulfoscipio gibsoniae]AGL03311.1 copper amine oxidase family protein [Desulfoscipio gibsoniae DSM 7213]